MTFLFETTATMKPYNRKKWWIAGDIVSRFKTDADDLKTAMAIYRDIVNNTYGVEISKNAIKTAQPMYIDGPDGEAIQTGYVITAKTIFDDDRARWVEQYIDLWVNISVISNPRETV